MPIMNYTNANTWRESFLLIRGCSALEKPFLPTWAAILCQTLSVDIKIKLFLTPRGRSSRSIDKRQRGERGSQHQVSMGGLPWCKKEDNHPEVICEAQ